MDDLELPVPPPLRYRSHEPVLTSAWTRVEQFSANRSTPEDQAEEDDEWEEEEVEYVTLDFGPHLSRQTRADATSFQLLAAESSTPFVRIGNQYFQGQHETSIGTEILLRPTNQNNADLGAGGGGGAGGENEGGEERDHSMEVFATTGSNRIVLRPVTIDYARRLPDLMAQGSIEGARSSGGRESDTGASQRGTRARGRGRGRGKGRTSSKGATPRSSQVTGEVDGEEEGDAERQGTQGAEDVEMQG